MLKYVIEHEQNSKQCNILPYELVFDSCIETLQCFHSNENMKLFLVIIAIDFRVQKFEFSN